MTLHQQILIIPNGWKETTLGEIAEINPPLPNIPEDQLEVSFLPMKAIEEITGKFNLGIEKKYSEVKKGFTAFINGDIIFAKITPCMENGKIAVLEHLKNGVGFGSTEFHVLRVRDIGISRKFLFYYLTQQAFRRDAKMHMTGSAGQLRVPAKYMESVSLLLPPANEQKRIVGKVEELFSFLDTGVASLKVVQAQIKRYNKAVLKAAFEGNLSEQWRTHKTNDLTIDKKTFVTDRQGLPLLPKGWKWVKLNELGYFRGGGTPSTQNPNFWGGEILWVSPKDMKEDFISRTELRITPAAIENSATTLIPKNSVLIVARSGILKRTLPVSINTTVCTVNQDIKVLVPYTTEMSNFIRLMLKAFESDILNNLVKEGTTVHSLKYNDFENKLYPVPPITEQKKIVDALDEHFLSIKKIEDTVNKKLISLENLRQSILKQAFAGNLIPQDPPAEPAEKLLERIKAKRLTNKPNDKQAELFEYVS